MEARTLSEVNSNDLDLWTLDDADAWKEAERSLGPDLWTEEDPVLDNDLWMDDCLEVLSVRGLGRLGIRVS